MIRYRFVMMTCTNPYCRRTEMRRVRGTCKYCGEGWMSHAEGKVRVEVKDDTTSKTILGEGQDAKNCPLEYTETD